MQPACRTAACRLRCATWPSLRAITIRTYPQFYGTTREKEFTWNKIRQYNRNPLLAMNIGADGMKTGFTADGGYGLVGSAIQNDWRLIVAVNGLKSDKERGDEAKRLLEWGYRTFEARLLFAEGQTVGDAKVFGGASGSVPLVGNGPINLMVPRNVNERIVARIVYTGPVRAPIEQGAASRQAAGHARRHRGAGSAAACGRERCPRRRDRPGLRCRVRTGDRAVSPDQSALKAPATELAENRIGTMRGRFITFEGGEGTGKSTQAALLAQRLRSFLIKVVQTREPGGSTGAEVIRHVILSGAAKPFGPEAEAILFAAARADHLAAPSAGTQRSGSWVVCDRYIDSTRAYQGARRQCRSAADPGAGAADRRRCGAGPDLHSRYRPARRAWRAPRRGAATKPPTASKARRSNFIPGCATPTWKIAAEQSEALRHHRCQRHEGAGRARNLGGSRAPVRSGDGASSIRGRVMARDDQPAKSDIAASARDVRASMAMPRPNSNSWRPTAARACRMRG